MRQDKNKTKSQLIDDLNEARKRIAALEDAAPIPVADTDLKVANVNAQLNIYKSEKRFEALFDNMPSGVAIYEAVDDGEDFMFKDFNSMAEKIDGIKKKELIDRRITEVFPGVKEFGLFSCLQRVWKTGKSEFFPEAMYVDEKLPEVWRENWVYKLPTNDIVAVYNDVTDRKKVEEKLRNSERQFRQLADNINEVFWLYDITLLKFVYVSPAFESIWGLASKAVLDNEKVLIAAVHPDDRKKMSKFTEISEMASGSNIEYRIIMGDKSVHWIRERRFPVYDKDEKVVRIAGLWTDITSFKEAAKKEKQHQEQLQQADKMASLGVLVSGVAHEVNNPNNFIMLNAPLLRETWEDAKPILASHYEKNRNFEMGGLPYPEIAETIPKLFDGIERGAQRIKCIVEDLKNYARQNTCSYTNIVNINQVVREAASLLKSLIEKSTDSFSMHLSSNDVLIQGNKQKLEQVVINLIQNACYALKEKGEAITVTVDTNGETCEIRVIDKGVGIPKAHLSQLTDPFFTTRRNSGGTGLGLSVSAGIVKEHRGTMVFDSKKGAGTTVKVILPLTRKKAIAE